MVASICLLSVALTFGQVAADRAEWQLAPQLTPGLELVYKGTYLDEKLIPNAQYQKLYHLETNLLVLETKAKDWQVALMTGLSMQDSSKVIDKKHAPMSVRLDLASIDFQGRPHAGAKLIDISMDGPPTLETGFLVAAPLAKVRRNFVWEVSESGKPTHYWQIVGTESCGGITCIKIVGLQQSEDWDQPRADKTAWRRRDTLWILPQLSVAQKVERIIERRDPARALPTQRTIARYELESKMRYPGSLFEERRQEILKAKKFEEDAEKLARQPGLYHPQIETMLQKVNKHLERPETNQYRKAFLHVQLILENAKRGQGLVQIAPEDPLEHATKILAIGDRVPEFAVGSLTEHEPIHLKNYLGKPVLIFFYNPHTPLGKEMLRFAKELSEGKGGPVAIMAMAVTLDADLVRKQHHEMHLTFPILDGNGMHVTFGVDQTPRLLLLDAEGFVRMAQTGWGVHTSYEIYDELERCRKKGP